MSRTVDPKRPRELREAIVEYLIANGLAALSLRPLAKAVGCSPRVLLYHFGSKENMVGDALAEVRRQQRAAFDGLHASSFTDACWKVWRRMSAPDSEPVFRLFFEVYGLALRNPRLYKDFLHDTIEQWLEPMASGLVAEGYRRTEARALATAVLAALRGFMLDFCATHNRKRVDRAVRMWLSGLDFSLRTMKGERP